MEKIKNNPLQTMMLMSLPLIFITNSFNQAFYGGLAFALILLISYGLSYLLNKILPEDIKIYAYVIITIALITVARLLLTWLTVSDAQQIGVYVSVAMFNFLFMYSNLEEGKIKPSKLLYVLYVFVFMVVLSVLREVLGTGSLTLLNLTTKLYDSKYGITVLTQSAGGFIFTGLVFASIQAIFNRQEKQMKGAK